MKSNKKLTNKMKIDVIGNGCSWVKELSASYIIDDKLMFDAPEGSFKKLYTSYDLLKIENIIISHLHNDHFLALHLIIQYYVDFEPSKKINILAPKRCKERLLQLIDCFSELYLKDYIENNINFIPCEDGKKYTLGDYDITAYKVEHSDIEAFGFVIEKENIKVGFSGDTSMCQGVKEIIKRVNTIFIDSTNILRDKKHLCCDEILELSNEFPKVKFYPIHMSKDSFKQIDKKFKICKEGSVLYLKK